ncbi:hypothetical protein [Pseudomonas agarici]|uniref:hypothetical protein n=1 Tax=Pseudomonas agarici TaxID=46677 RepID=UPI000364044B|nr:hypothetical protein [Pseudomonas agarici]SEL39616.1 hypothetical protein SAMN05216604_11725 [Pseudomonas agarici]
MLYNPRLDSSMVSSGSVRSLDAKVVIWIPAVSAALYPWILDAFHWVVAPAEGKSDPLSANALLAAALLLIAAFAVPLICLMTAGSTTHAASGESTRARRLALLAVAAPTLYVFFGVLTYMAGSKIADTWIWSPAWLLLGYWASRKGAPGTRSQVQPSSRLRVVHGIAGAITALYVLFHIFNHLFGLISPQAHAAVMDMGRTVYRAAAIEPLLVAVMLFQIVSGLRLAWTWTETKADRYRVFQVASGVFMSMFILGHMNSVFIYARTFLNIPTDWAFAAGLPAGLIHDAWNIRLLPHYALGVFFVLTHLFSGLRVVLLAHRVDESRANRIGWLGAGISLLISAAIMSGMTGLRLI